MAVGGGAGMSREEAASVVGWEYANRPLKPLQSIQDGSVRGGATCLHDPAVTGEDAGAAATPPEDAAPL